MSSSHSNKKGKKYRYYETRKNICPVLDKITKLSVGEIETFVQTQLLKLVRDQKFIQEYLIGYDVELQTKILNTISTFEPDKIFIRNSINRIDLKLEEIKIIFNVKYMIQYFIDIVNKTSIPLITRDKLLVQFNYKVKISLTPKKHNKIVIPGQTNYNMKLINAIIQSFWVVKKCADNELTREEKLCGNRKRYRNLRFLPSDIIEDIMLGKQDSEMNINRLLKMVGQ